MRVKDGAESQINAPCPPILQSTAPSLGRRGQRVGSCGDGPRTRGRHLSAGIAGFLGTGCCSRSIYPSSSSCSAVNAPLLPRLCSIMSQAPSILLPVCKTLYPHLDVWQVG